MNIVVKTKTGDMKKASLLTAFLLILMLSSTITVLAVTTPVTVSGVITGTISASIITENNRKLHIRGEDETVFFTVDLDGLPAEYDGSHNVLLFEARLNLKNSRTTTCWAWSEGGKNYRLYCYGSGDGGSGDYTINVDKVEVWEKKEHGAGYKRKWSQTYDPLTTLLDIDF